MGTRAKTEPGTPAKTAAPKPRPKERADVSTPWGRATVVEEAVVRQQAGERRFASIAQLLVGPRGEQFVRFAYTTDGVARRGPVTLRARDLDRLRQALESRPGLASLLRLGGDA